MKNRPNLDTLTYDQLSQLVKEGKLVRRWGAVWGMSQKDYWGWVENPLATTH
jgi:hypothetical protein